MNGDGDPTRGTRVPLPRPSTIPDPHAITRALSSDAEAAGADPALLRRHAQEAIAQLTTCTITRTADAFLCVRFPATVTAPLSWLMLATFTLRGADGREVSCAVHAVYSDEREMLLDPTAAAAIGLTFPLRALVITTPMGATVEAACVDDVSGW